VNVTGDHLHINIDSWRGRVLVEMLDADTMQPVPGFGKDECIPTIVNSIDATVRWKGNANLASLQGKTVRLRFHLWQAEMYAFWFGG